MLVLQVCFFSLCCWLYAIRKLGKAIELSGKPDEIAASKYFIEVMWI